MVTTDSIKFKAKSWIDVFGGRASKALGSVIATLFQKEGAQPHRSPRISPRSPRYR